MVVIDERALDLFPGIGTTPDIDERAARRSLRDQIARIERELGQAFISAFPRTGVDVRVPAPGGPRMLGLGDLERLRDDLAERLHEARRGLEQRGIVEERNRALLERMLLEPGRYRFVRVSNRDLGEDGCGVWHVRPRLGLIGMMMGWWQVKLSSGCPLATGGAARRRP
jgi:hypothetical protein